jgi:isopentenyl phosphate kinase
MSGPLFLKLGGALVTDKERRETVREDVLARLAQELAAWWPAATAPVVLAHGSGSFAHVAVAETGFGRGAPDPLAFARVAAAARRLDGRVAGALLAAGLPVVPVPGSLLARCSAGRVAEVRCALVRDLLAGGLVPLVYGDAAPDRAGGGCVASTEGLLVALATELAPRRIVLATDVDGVFTADPALAGPAPGRAIGEITPADRAAVLDGLSGARAGVVDVTGGMASKVTLMLDLVQALPGLEVRVLSGLRPGAVVAALDGAPGAGGTLIHAPAA